MRWLTRRFLANAIGSWCWTCRWQLIIPLVAVAFVLIGDGWITVWALNPGKEAAPRTSDQLLETTKGLEVTQQQAVNQLQIVQDQLLAQQAETKRLSAQIATLTERLDALQQSVPISPRRPAAHYRNRSLRRDSGWTDKSLGRLTSAVSAGKTASMGAGQSQTKNPRLGLKTSLTRLAAAPAPYGVELTTC